MGFELIVITTFHYISISAEYVQPMLKMLGNP